MDGEREDDQRDDAALEVSDLRPKAGRLAHGSGAGRASRQIIVTLDARFARGVALVALALVVTLGVLLANSPGLRAGIGTSLAGPTATPTESRFTIVSSGSVGSIQITVATAIPSPTPFPTPTPFAPPLGPAPTTCAPSATQPSVGGIATGATAVGADSVWVDAFDGARATIAITRDASDPYSLYGWPIPFALAFTSGFGQPVTLRGESLADGHPLWFTFNGAEEMTPVPLFTLDPGDARGLNVSSDRTGAHWWNGSLYLPGSGCFALEASWPGGQWRAVFAASR